MVVAGGLVVERIAEAIPICVVDCVAATGVAVAADAASAVSVHASSSEIPRGVHD